MRNLVVLFGLCLLPYLSESVSAQNPNDRADGHTASALIVAFDSTSEPIRFGVSQLAKALVKSGQSFREVPLLPAPASTDLTVRIITNSRNDAIQSEGFLIENRQGKVTIAAVDAVGAMYGVMDVAEQIG